MKNYSEFAQLLVVVVISALVGFAKSNPAPLFLWDHPCNTAETPPPLDPVNATADINVFSPEALAIAQQLRQQVTADQIRNMNVIEWLDQWKLIEVPPHHVHELELAMANPIETFETHYNLLYELMAHLEVAKTEASREPEYQSLMEQLRQKVYSMVCSFQRGILSDEAGSTEVHASEDDATPVSTESLQSQRDYVLLKDAEKVFKFFEYIYPVLEGYLASFVDSALTTEASVN